LKLLYQTENWNPFLCRELQELVEQQWREIALDRDEIPLDVGWEGYDSKSDNIIVSTVRTVEHGNLVGWYMNFVGRHPHYKTTTFAFLDQYYLMPEYRKGNTAVRLFLEMERAMRERGVKQMISISKLHIDSSKLFDFLKWRKTGITYTKVL
jgi:Acetyltransferase (GNAT) family